MEVLRGYQKTFQTAVQSAQAEHNLKKKRFNMSALVQMNLVTRSEEPMEIGHIRPQRKYFLYHKGEHVSRECRSTRAKSVNAVEQGINFKY